MNDKRLRCIKCDRIVAKQDNFCPYCGQNQKAVCSVCGKNVKDVDKGHTIFICSRKCGLKYLDKMAGQIRRKIKRSASAATDTDLTGI